MTDDADLEVGCWQLRAKLNQELKGLSRRIDAEEDTRKRLVNESGRIIASLFLQLGEFQPDLGSSREPEDQDPRPKQKFGHLLEDLGKLETETLAALIAKNARTAANLAGKQIATENISTKNRENVFRPGERRPERNGHSQMDCKISIQVLGQVLRDEKNNPISPEQKRKLLELHSRAIELTDIIDSLNVKVSGMFGSYNRICEISNYLEKISGLYWRMSTARATVRAATCQSHGHRPGGTGGTGSSTLAFTEEYQKTLIAEINTLRNALTKYEARMKKLLSERPELIPAVTAILEEIQLLCDNQIVTDVPDITIWKVSAAARRWPSIKGSMPAGSKVSRIKPELIGPALLFLMQNEEFLDTYNNANRARAKSAALCAELRILQATIDDVQINSLVVDGQNDTSNKLAKAVFDASKDAQVASKELERLIGDIAGVAGLPRNILLKSANDIWNILWRNTCKRSIDQVSKELDWIDAKLSEANRKIAVRN